MVAFFLKIKKKKLTIKEVLSLFGLMFLYSIDYFKDYSMAHHP